MFKGIMKNLTKYIWLKLIKEAKPTFINVYFVSNYDISTQILTCKLFKLSYKEKDCLGGFKRCITEKCYLNINFIKK